MKFVKLLPLWLRALHPRYWVKNFDTCSTLTAKVNSELDNGNVQFTSTHYHVIVGPMRLWTANYPYAFGEIEDKMPDRKTVIRLHDYIEDGLKELKAARQLKAYGYK